MSIKSSVRSVVAKLAPQWLHQRYLDYATPTEAEIRLLPALVPIGGVAVDIGANRGLFVHHLLERDARVIAFEPLPEMQAYLRRIYGERIDLRCMALSDAAGTAEIRYPRGNHSWATLASSNQLEMSDVDIVVTSVEMATLDSLGLPAPAFMKIDVEGFEEAVLRGAADTLRAAMPNLLIEVEERHNRGSTGRIFATTAAAGYAGYFLDGGRLVSVAQFDAERDQRVEGVGVAGKVGRYINNFIFVPQARSTAFLAEGGALLNG